MNNSIFETTITTNSQTGSAVEHTSENMPARAFFFVVVDEIGNDGYLTRKVYASLDDPYLKAMNLPNERMLNEVFPERYGLKGKDLTSNATIAEHVMGVNTKSRYTSTSSIYPEGSPRFQGKPIYIDINKAISSGAKLVSTQEIIDALEEYKSIAPKRIKRINQIIGYVRDIDREILVTDSIPARAIFTDDSLRYVKTIGKVGKVVQLFGFAFTAYDLTIASKESIKTQSMAPISAEVLRQASGWGAGVAGLKMGTAIGVTMGIETGPGAVITGLIGGVIFGAAGYLGADWVADFIYEN